MRKNRATHLRLTKETLTMLGGTEAAVAASSLSAVTCFCSRGCNGGIAPKPDSGFWCSFLCPSVSCPF